MMRKKPMLAYPVSDKPINYNEPIFMQPKLDGVRCVIQYENMGLEYEVKAYSRTVKSGKTYTTYLNSLSLSFKSIQMLYSMVSFIITI